MAEAIVPFCQDLLADRSCPYQDPDDESIEFRSPTPAGELPIFEHPFQGLDSVLMRYWVRCETLPKHPEHYRACTVREMGFRRNVPDECEQLASLRGWDYLSRHNIERGMEGENLRISTHPGCPIPQTLLLVIRSVPGDAIVEFEGTFLRPGVKPPWKEKQQEPVATEPPSAEKQEELSVTPEAPPPQPRRRLKPGTHGRILSLAPSVDGEMDPSLVLKVVRTNVAPIKACYDATLKRRGAVEGDVHAVWTITPKGRVFEPWIGEDALDDPKLARCLRGALAKLRFPPPGKGKVEVIYRFRFSLPEDAVYQEDP